MAGKRTATRRETGETAAEAVVGAPAATVAGVAGPTEIMLPADCRMAAQPSLKEQLLGALGAGAIVLDGSRVERADTAVLQLLLLFRREVAMGGGSLSWSGASDALSEAAAVLGLTQTLEMPAPAPV